MTSTFSFNFWDGFLSGLYSDKIEKLAADTCLGGKSLEYLKSATTLTETTTKEMFFIHLAGVLRDLVGLAMEIRANCRLDDVIGDFIRFCQTECEPQKVLSRFAVNMNAVGQVYTELLIVLFEN